MCRDCTYNGLVSEGNATQEREQAIRLIRQAVDLVGCLTSTDDIGHLTVCTAEAREKLDGALNELMAAGVLEGRSLRSVAAQVGLAPNSVAARMARSQSLAAYSEGGRVGTEGVQQARAERSQPLRFQRRRPTP